MHRSDVGQRATIGDVDLQLAGVDETDEAGELRSIAVDEDALCARPSSRSHFMARMGACGKAPDVLHNHPANNDEWGLL